MLHLPVQAVGTNTALRHTVWVIHYPAPIPYDHACCEVFRLAPSCLKSIVAERQLLFHSSQFTSPSNATRMRSVGIASSGIYSWMVPEQNVIGLEQSRNRACHLEFSLKDLDICRLRVADMNHRTQLSFTTTLEIAGQKAKIFTWCPVWAAAMQRNLVHCKRLK
jgi:hypothetical protein